MGLLDFCQIVSKSSNNTSSYYQKLWQRLWIIRGALESVPQDQWLKTSMILDGFEFTFGNSANIRNTFNTIGPITGQWHKLITSHVQRNPCHQCWWLKTGMAVDWGELYQTQFHNLIEHLQHMSLLSDKTSSGLIPLRVNARGIRSRLELDC
jgi:hypothetical protein